MNRRWAKGSALALVVLSGLGTLTAGCARSRPRTPPVALPQPRPPSDVLEPEDRIPREAVEPVRPPQIPPITPPEAESEEPEPAEQEPQEAPSAAPSASTEIPALAVSREPGETRRLIRETRELLDRIQRTIAGVDASRRERHEASVTLILDLVARSQDALDSDDPELAHNLAIKAQALARDL